MRIAVNTRLLLRGKLEGIGWFTHEVLKRIVDAHPEHEFIFLFDRPFDPDFVYGANVTPVVVSPPARHPILFYVWFEWRIPTLLKRYKADIFLSPDGYLSLRSNIPQLPVIHDINFEHFPQYVPLTARLHYRYYFRKYARKASRIATVSEYSKSDIVETYGVSPSKVDVVYNGVNEAFRPLSVDEVDAARSEYAKGKPFLLFVGAIHPRKNLPNQLKAYTLFRQATRADVAFIVVGATYWTDKELDEILNTSEFRDDIIFLGRQDVASLVKLYGAAVALMYVSNFEGFGIPLIEAMQAEIPVITSSNTAMPEICGDAGIICEPDNIDGIADAIKRIYSDEVLRSSLIDKGKIQRAKFSWDKTAKALWESITKAVE
jgi:glycosyltransferase involved in cell wall biosynthesis